MGKVMTEHMYNMHKVEDSFHKEIEYKNAILSLVSDKELEKLYDTSDNKEGFFTLIQTNQRAEFLNMLIWLVLFFRGITLNWIICLKA